MAEKKQVIQLYRALLKVTKKWHYDPTRADRSIRDHITSQIHRQFRDNISASSSQVPTLIEHGKNELAALKQLQSNYFDLMYPITTRIVPELTQKSKVLLSDVSQSKIKKRKWGLADKIWGFTDSKDDDVLVSKNKSDQ
eukprot:TRINITY_DN2400_c0_g1_i1.p1 TRINITY_DN2400_c0_g1~~TRINITY_DN2400_c0_g1_i1.p1  ORF type:complete len:139 (-),score=43.63 TRINITY_DN2400_c0_g1_i1:16-432(-)